MADRRQYAVDVKLEPFLEVMRADKRIAYCHISEGKNVTENDKRPGFSQFFKAGKFSFPLVPINQKDQAGGMMQAPGQPGQIDQVPQSHHNHAAVHADPGLAGRAEYRKENVVAAPGG